ncbi:MAG: alpha/beta fold hydrolase [Wenzhouxiangellaceae bacterium]|nr:alpha/beta fold hydrolase [Wenzhouxiangellaceae bacterium]
MPDSEVVVLVHGLWVGKFTLWPLQRRLGRLGWSCRRFGYPTVRRNPSLNAHNLAAFCHRLEADKIHWVGHSLGGLLVLSMLQACGQNLPPGRAVLLGSPVRGSAVARRMVSVGWLKALIGQSAGSLNTAFEQAPPGREVGTIAGTAQIGAGRVVARLDRPHDGTVAVSETRLAGARDHLELPVSHTGLVLSKRVARAIDGFLKNGCFTPGFTQTTPA